MTRHSQALNLQPSAAAHLEINNRQSDRNAGPPVEDSAEKAIARIVIICLVAMKALVIKHEFIKGLDSCARSRSNLLRCCSAQLVDQGKVMGDVDFSLFFGSYQ